MDNIKLNPVFSAEELMNQEFKPTQWLIDNLLPEGLTVLSGAPKIGKSFLSLELAVAVATQGSILGHCASKARGVLVLALEDGPSRLFNRMQSAKFTISEKLYFAVDWPAKSGPDRLREYLVADPEIDLVIIDTLGFFLPPTISRGHSAYDSDVSRMRIFKEIMEATQTSIIVIHHDKQGEEGDWTAKINGTSGIIGTADTLIRLSVKKRGSREASLQITGRDIEDIELALVLDDSRMRWRVDRTRDLDTLSPLQMRVLNLIPFAPKSISVKEIKNTIDKKAPQVSELLRKLLDRGHIEKLDYGQYTRSNTQTT